MFAAKITNCFDSHLHWLAIGDVASRLDLRALSGPDHLGSLQLKPEHLREQWIFGFGWDETGWTQAPNRHQLDQVFPNNPVVFSRADGHAFWVNTLALKRAGLFEQHQNVSFLKAPFIEVQGGRIGVEVDGWPSGLLIDRAREPFDRVLPPLTPNLIRDFLLLAQQQLHQQGFTHIRDMTCTEEQWDQAYRLDEQGALKLYVLQNFSVDHPEDFQQALTLANRARRDSTPHLIPSAIKVFYDGALGSEGALLSQNYGSGSGRGFRLVEPARMKDIMREIGSHQWDIAVHVIGDQAVDEIVQIGCELFSEGFKNKIHLEHAELIRRETVQRMRHKNFICHMQPSHWLSDRRWAQEKLGPLTAHLFRWRDLEEQGVPFYFGSDAPIEPLGVLRTLQALNIAVDDGIASLLRDPLVYHACDLVPSLQPTYSVFKEGKVQSIVFDGKPL